MPSPEQPRRWHPRRKKVQKAPLGKLARLILFLVSALAILAIGAVSYGFLFAHKPADETREVEENLSSLQPLMAVGKDWRARAEALRANTNLTSVPLVGKLVSRPKGKPRSKAGAATNVLLHAERVRQSEAAADAAVAGADTVEAFVDGQGRSAPVTNLTVKAVPKRKVEAKLKFLQGGRDGRRLGAPRSGER